MASAAAARALAALLFGPPVASAEAVIMGVEEPPGPWTLCGGVVIACGGTLIAAQAHRQSTTVELGQPQLHEGLHEGRSREPTWDTKRPGSMAKQP